MKQLYIKRLPVKLIFEETTEPFRIAEMIEILSDMLGEELLLVQVNQLPPNSSDMRKVG